MADIGSRIAVLEERSTTVGEDIAEIQADVKCIKKAIYEMAATLRALKWVAGVAATAMGGGGLIYAL
jgi:hypothetical protein